MRRTATKVKVAAVGAALAVGLGVAIAGGPASSSFAAATPGNGNGNGVLEVNVSTNPTRINGQPVIAVNPRNENVQVFVTANHIGGATLSRLECSVSWSRDGGRSWQDGTWPMGDSPQCGDPYLAVDSRGTFYVAFNMLGCPGDPTGPPAGTCNGVPNKVGVARSTDGGRSWSEPVATPVARGTTPRLRVDLETDDVYVVGGVGAPSPAAVTVSRDQGRTWAQLAPLPSQPYSNQIAIHDGLFATATGMRVVNGTQVETATPTFWVSDDDGATFTSYPVTDSDGQAVAPATGGAVPNILATPAVSDPIPWVSADPSHRGRFAVMVPRDDTLEVYVTSNAGRDWRGPAVIDAPGAFKPWIDYGPTGVLGVMWRQVVDGNVSAYSTISFDRGRSFSPTLKVNKVSYPYNFSGSGGDEWSRILIQGRYAYVTWADSRTGGEIDGIVAKVPLSKYREASRAGRGAE